MSACSLQVECYLLCYPIPSSVILKTNTMNNLINFRVLIIAIAVLLFNSCRKDDDSFESEDTSFAGSSITADVAGIVRKPDGQPLSACNVTINGQSIVTDANGIFIFYNIGLQSRTIVTCESNVYGNATKAFITKNACNYVNIIYPEVVVSPFLNSSMSQTFTALWGNEVIIPANALVKENGTAYSGMYKLDVSYLNPDSANFNTLVPGGDLMTNTGKVLYSYGMMRVEIKSAANEKLQLNGTAQAQIKFPIAASQMSSANAVIPAWHFDETKAEWIEEGTATKSGNKYIMNVNHFSWWNCDYTGTRATVEGIIKDCHGALIPNAVITFNGMYTTTTNANGYFSVWVPAGMSINMQLLYANNPFLGINSSVYSIPALGAGQIYTVPSFSVSCLTLVSGTVQGCNGTPLNAYIMYTYNNQVCYQVPTNGQFTLAVPSLTSLTLYFQTSTSQFDTTITTPGQGGSMTFPITMCDTSVSSNGPVNTILVDGGQWNNQPITIDTTPGSFGQYLNTGGTYMVNVSIGNFAAPQFLNLYVAATQPGIYSLSSNAGNNIYYKNIVLGLETPGPAISGTFEVVEIGPVGGRIRVNFDLFVPVHDFINGVQIPAVHMTGVTDVVRTL
jgi:hypothetical protein